MCNFCTLPPAPFGPLHESLQMQQVEKESIFRARGKIMKIKWMKFDEEKSMHFRGPNACRLKFELVFKRLYTVNENIFVI